jgi:surface protein
MTSAVKKSKTIKVKNSMLKKKTNRTKKRIKKKKWIRPRQVGGVGLALNTDTLIKTHDYLDNKDFLSFCSASEENIDLCEKNIVFKKRLLKIRKSVMTDATIRSCVFNWILDRGGAADIYPSRHTVEEGFRQSVLPIGDWDVSAVTEMSYLFNPAMLETRSKLNDPASLEKFSSFNEDLSKWDVTNVTNMKGMFADAKSFNENLEWKDKVGNVTDMEYMFSGAESFNNDSIKKWKVNRETNMKCMFFMASKFNQHLWSWQVSEEANTEDMFFMSGIPERDWSNYAPSRRPHF